MPANQSSPNNNGLPAIIIIIVRPLFRPDGAVYKRGKTKKSVDLSHARPAAIAPQRMF